MELQPHPNETTTLTLEARGARRAALGSGPLRSALRASVIWIGRSNPRFLA